MHGVSLDTDGDGVPDCRDKEKITPTECQPVDADGVGKCPYPQCCKDLNARLDTMSFKPKCAIGNLPSVTFKGRTVTLSKDNQALLATAAVQMRNNPTCKNTAVIGYGESSKAAQQLSWDRMQLSTTWLRKKALARTALSSAMDSPAVMSLRSICGMVPVKRGRIRFLRHTRTCGENNISCSE